MVASELLEAGRAMQNGFVTPDRTTLIASTHRIYTVAEKMQMGDGRFDSEPHRQGRAGDWRSAPSCSTWPSSRHASGHRDQRRAVRRDGRRGRAAAVRARRARTRSARRGKGAEASLRGFALGYAHATGEAQPAVARGDASAGAPTRSSASAARFPAETHRILEEGVARAADFQDAAYATLYLDRLEPVAKLEREAVAVRRVSSSPNETGRFLALWMCYEDVIRVADLKSRRSPLRARARRSAGASRTSRCTSSST